MDINMALSRVKEIQENKERIQEHLKYIGIGYITDTQKNYRVKFSLPKVSGDERSENNDLPGSHNVSIRLDEIIVKQLLEKELSGLNTELEVLSPVIEAANCRRTIKLRNGQNS